ncbi:MAG: putative phosphorylase b kinase gamma catalytic chain [Streblomastix strix]|uniref:Putative phosphorylase b kinase gamma catalytic chain n=1 Tax=Streblomastix strix TaxID=222440 RepID=A0A5J4WJX9_9EUKA|nr:MAG: putative phosphorylase b kinase gamma catalytic chain [Streblomastix strix]
MEYCNMKTLNIIVKQQDITLPSFTLRALMKQTLQGLKVFHAAGLIHRDIKCDNILLHNPPGSGFVYAKISDFGFAERKNQKNELSQFKETLPYMGPEMFQQTVKATQKVDIYALGITFYHLLTRNYPIYGKTITEHQKKMAQTKNISRPQQIKDDHLWDLLSKLLEFDPDKRITAEQALQHPYFTSPEAIADVSKEQQDLALLAAKVESKGNLFINNFDKDPTYIVAESTIKEILLKDILKIQKKQQHQKT